MEELSKLRDRFLDLASKEKEREAEAAEEGDMHGAEIHQEKAASYQYCAWCVEKKIEEKEGE